MSKWVQTYNGSHHYSPYVIWKPNEDINQFRNLFAANNGCKLMIKYNEIFVTQYVEVPARSIVVVHRLPGESIPDHFLVCNASKWLGIEMDKLCPYCGVKNGTLAYENQSTICYPIAAAVVT